MQGVELLRQKLARASERLVGVRNPGVRDVFRRVLYIWPHWIRVRELGGREPFAAFNPAVVLHGDRLQVFPRLIVGYFWYTSLIGFFELPLDDVLEGHVETPIEARVILHPYTRRDLAGCEDPRAAVFDDRLYILYTALEPRPDRVHAVNAVSQQGLAVFDANLSPIRRMVFDIVDREGKRYSVGEVKDSALLKPADGGFTGLTRPVIDGVGACWRGFFDVEHGVIPLESLEPVLLPEPWELKVGWSTNAVKLGSDEYLVAWHGVGRDLIYRTGFAVVNGDGELLGLTGYLLEPRTVQEFSGERPGVIFGCGLALKGNLLIYVGGVADTAIGVYVAELDKIMEHVKWLKRG